jgi:hypothetical protein
MELPMPSDAVTHIGELGCHQEMPKTLTFTDHFGFELPDVDDDVDDEHNSDYEPDNDDASKDNSTISLVPSTHLSDDDDSDDDLDDDDDDNDDDDITQPLPGLSAGVNTNNNDDDDYGSDTDEGDSEVKRPISDIGEQRQGHSEMVDHVSFAVHPDMKSHTG